MSSPAARVLVCKWHPEMLAALLEVAAEVHVVLDHFDVEHMDPDWDLLGRAASVRLVSEFDSLDELAAVAAERQLHGGVDRVISFTEFSQFGAGYLALVLGVETADATAHVAVRDKRLMKARVAAAGVTTTPWVSVADADELDAASLEHSVGFPLVLKPATGFGTMSTVRIDRARDLSPALAELIWQPNLKSRQMIAERFVEGRELHVDALWDGDQALYFVLSAYYTPRLSLVDDQRGAGAPVDGSRALTQREHPRLHAEVLALHRKVNRALGITRAATHLELFERPDGELVFSEIATRLGGGWIPGVLSAHMGYDVHRAVAHGLVSGEIPAPRPSHSHIGALHLGPSRPGTITSVPSREQALALDGVLDATVLCAPGTDIDLAHPSQWCVFVVLGANTAAEYEALTDRVHRELRVETGAPATTTTTARRSTVLTASAIEAMDYNQLIGVVRETNRPPGGMRSIALVAQNGFLTRDSHVLEIGTSTGITAVELAKLVGCRVTAIDINEDSLAEARRRAEHEGVAHLVTFERKDATNTGYPDGTFDMVFCGNVTSLINDRERALTEYTRVLKLGGFIGAIPMYYVDEPSERLIADVSAAIQVDIVPHYRQFWLDFFTGAQRHVNWAEHYRFDALSTEAVDEFVEDILRRPHLAELAGDAREVLAKKYREHMQLFRVNLSHMGFTVLLLRKENADVEPELFTSTRV